MRSGSGTFARALYDSEEQERTVVGLVGDVANRHVAKMVQVAIIWLLGKPDAISVIRLNG